MKTGQYGVGFNVVYHVTDAPSFWSKGGELGEVICMFDPHCKYLTTATERRPGAKFQANKMKGYADFLEGYLPKFTKTLNQGTLFRLPLRLKDMAESSKIRNKETTTQHIKKIINILKSQICSCMLFLENITTVKIGTVSDNGKLVIEHEISSSIDEEDREKHSVYNKHLTTLAHKIDRLDSDTFKLKPIETVYALTIRNTIERNEERYVIVKRAGFVQHSTLPKQLNEAYKQGRVKKLPRGGVAIRLSKLQNRCPNGLAYCTLPLPISTGLPVHVNGQFALDHESRRNLRNEEKSDEALWNKHLSHFLIVPSYVAALVYMKDYLFPKRQRTLSEGHLGQFEALFPSISQTRDIFWKDLSKELYKWMAKNISLLFPVFIEEKIDNSTWKIILWTSVQIGDDGPFAGCFNTLHNLFGEVKPQNTAAYRSHGLSQLTATIGNTQKPTKEDILVRCLVKLGMQVLQSSTTMLQQFEDSDVDVQIVSPKNTLRFLKSFSDPMPNGCVLENLPSPISSTGINNSDTLELVLRFVMKDMEEDINGLLGAPLLLRQNGVLDVFNLTNTIIVSRFCRLLPEHSAKFLSFKFVPLMNEYLTNFTPLHEWSLTSFAKMLGESQQYNVMCRGQVVILNKGAEVDEWLREVWRLIETFIPSKANMSTDLPEFRPLINLSLLPVEISATVWKLYPLLYANCIVYLLSGDRTYVNDKIKSVLSKLGVPRIVPSFDYPGRLVAQIDNPSAILDLLCKNIADLPPVDINLALNLWKYFGQKFDDLNNKSKIKLLSIFETMDREFIPLSGEKHFVCLRDTYPSVPSQGNQYWSRVTNVQILRYYEDLKPIYQHLGIQIIKPVGLYIRFVLEHFHGFRAEDQLLHLKYIRDNLWRVVTEDEKTELVSKLATTKFIPYDGTPRVVSDFYDDQNEVFQVMGDHLKFLPDLFNSVEWKPFLIAVGLNSKVSHNMFVTFAKIVETNAQTGLNPSILDQSRVLVNHLVSSDLTFTNIYNDIKDIEFVERYTLPATDFRNQIHPQFGHHNKLISFKGSFTINNIDFIWTNRIILPIHTGINKLCCEKTVSTETFLANLKNICASLKNKRQFKEIDEQKLIALFESTYSFIDDKLEEIANKLNNEFIILIPKVGVVKTSRIIIDPFPGQTITDYVFKSPSRFSRYNDLFEHLGARKHAVPDMYVEVLRDIYTACRGHPPHANESQTVIECVWNLTTFWTQKFDHKQAMNQPHLYLPDNKKVMTKSTELLLVDNESFFRRLSNFTLSYFIGFKALNVEGFYLGHQYWPKQYQMKLLSDVVKMTLCKDSIVNAGQGCISCSIKNMLRNTCLVDGIARLVRHEHKKRNINSEELLTRGIQAVSDIEILEVANLLTSLTYEGEEVTGSGKQVDDFYLKEREADKWRVTLYINKGRKNATRKCHQKLSDIFELIFYANISNHFRQIWELMVDDKPEDIKTYLDDENIDMLDIDWNIELLPSPGTIIPNSIHWLLDNSFTDFRDGEYVGYEVYDPDIEEHIESIEDSPVYIYAKIVKKVNCDTDIEFATYELNVGEEAPIMASITRIYKFYRPAALSSQEVVPYKGGSSRIPSNEGYRSGEAEINVEAILKEIRDILTKSWKVSSEKERKRVVKRLLLKWHPDKNPNNITKATEITQTIFIYVQRLDNGQSLEDSTESDSTDGTSHAKTYSPYDDFYDRMRSRGSSYANNSRTYANNSRSYAGGERSSSGSSYNHYHSSAQNTPNPMPGQASRWLRQAEQDLAAAEQELNSDADAHNWICYKCQQSAEKALKAVWYNIDGNKVNQCHNLNEVSRGMPNATLIDLAYELQSLIGEHTRMRYPDTLSYPRIPYDVYTHTQSERAFELTQSIVEESGQQIHNSARR